MKIHALEKYLKKVKNNFGVFKNNHMYQMIAIFT